MATSAPSSTYNILFLGETQSGKSTLIEALKQYSDPKYTVNSVNIGDGIFSRTREVVNSTIVTDRPDYFVSKDTNIGLERVDYGDFITSDQEAYEDSLNERRAYVLERAKSNDIKATFKLIDTPGLNDTALFDESNIVTIFKALEDIKSINLVAITLANNPFTDGLRNALQAYIDLLPEFNGNIVFVHTKVDYAKFHPNETHFSRALAEKKNILHRIMGRDSVPHLLIDNDIGSKKTIRNCITQNKLRELLAMAKLNQPVPLQVMMMKKTEKMRIVDQILKAKFDEVIKARETTLGFKNQAQKDVLARIADLKAKIAQHDQALKNIERDLSFYDKDSLTLQHEQIHQQSFSMLSLNDGPQTMCYPGKSQSKTSGGLQHILDHVDIQAHNVEVMENAGGTSSAFWAAQFRNKKRQNGLYHVKIYVSKKKKFAENIQLWRTQQRTLQGLHDNYKADLNRFEHQEQQQSIEIEELLEQLRLDWYLHGRVSSTHLDKTVLQALVEAKVYVRECSQSALNVQRFYSERKDELESIERLNDYIIPPPVCTSEFSNDAGKDIVLDNSNANLADLKSIFKQLVDNSSEGLTSVEKLSHLERQPDIAETCKDAKIHYVLVLGKSQAGKSALIQHIKSYAAQDYPIDESLLGDGTFSKTDTTRSFPVKSDLPSYEAFNKRTGEVFDHVGLGYNFKTDEDYQDFLLSSEANVGLRPATQDHGEPSLDEIEFEFVDTPGLCNHEDKDSTHALSVIETIVATRSFSLVLIVVNPHDPLSAELLLALQYYAEILGDLRNKIAFVFTHVDYLHSRLVNTDESLALEEKARSLGRIFRGSVVGDVESYPSFTIDLTQKKRPVVLCMIRNTLKDILQFAISNPATMVNTTSENVERVKSIPHPSNFDNKKRKAALDLIYGEPEPRSKVITQKKKTARRSTPRDVNILLIGDVQSGKTSLIETMKLYAELGSVTNKELVVRGHNGDGNEIISATSFLADLHTLEIHALKNGRHRIVDLDKDATALSPEAFDEVLNLEEGSVSIRRIHPSVAKQHCFTVYEVPGIREAEDIEGKILAIYRTIVESETDIHHILVALAPNSITTITKTFVSLLTAMFAEIQPHISFVHTKIDYHHLHVSKEKFFEAMKEEQKQLQGLTQARPLAIDCRQHADRPILRAMSQNAVHSILQTAVLNQPDCSVLTLVKPKYSVLVLGQTQSAKSTFVQHLKNYANPVHQSFLGNDYVSKTMSTARFFVDSNFPLYEVQEKNDGSIVNIQNLHARFDDEEDYLKLLAGREKDYTLRISPQDLQSPAPRLVEFQFLDTPGLNDVDRRDAIFADNTIQEIYAAQKFNLVLIVVSANNPLSMGYGFALEYYAKVLEGLHSNIAFLYTHVNYADCHYSNTAHQDKMLTRHRAFSRIFRHRSYAPVRQDNADDGDSLENESFYHNFAINMKLEKRPIIQCLIRNTLRCILQLAVTNPPVSVDTSEANIERIRTLVHPDKANKEYHDRFREAKSAKLPLELPARGDGGFSASWRDVPDAGLAVVTKGPAPMTLVDLSESDRDNLTAAAYLTDTPQADESTRQHSPTREHGNIGQPIHGNNDQSIDGNVDQPIHGNIDQSLIGNFDQPTHNEDDHAEIDPEGLPLGGMTFNEQSSTNSEVEKAADNLHFDGQYDVPQNLDFPISEFFAEQDSLDLGDSLDDGASAPEGVKEYVLPSTTYNVLFLGETQSGKSTLIESLKQYANPDYTINTRRIGDGTFSLTNDVKIERITSNLPTSFIFKTSDNTQEPVDHEAFIKEDQEDYEDELNDRKSYQLATEQSNLPNAYYNLVDTPGLNNTGSNDKSTLEYIFKRIGNISELNLVVVTVSNNPFTQDLKDALESYFKLLKDFKGHLVFVHTKIDYAKLHREDDQFRQLLEEKNEILHELLGQTAPHVMIDNDLGSKKAVRNCMTQNYLRNLLDRARTNEPVLLPAKYRYTPPVYPAFSHSNDPSWASFSPFGVSMGYQGHMGGIAYANDPRYAATFVFIADVLAASGIAPMLAFHPVVIARFQKEYRHHCPRQRRDLEPRRRLHEF
ncbi:hypothetical protein BG003_009610 [Podila horticola]|nr:hypothetical protein BG003_009610 [Podila horticola]